MYIYIYNAQDKSSYICIYIYIMRRINHHTYVYIYIYNAQDKSLRRSLIDELQTNNG